MPQVSKRAANHFILNCVEGLDEDELIRIENHKNDRFLEIKRTDDQLEVREEGYITAVHNTDICGLKSLLGRIIDYEFPRSHKLRIKIRKPNESSRIKMSPWSARKIR